MKRRHGNIASRLKTWRVTATGVPLALSLTAVSACAEPEGRPQAIPSRQADSDSAMAAKGPSKNVCDDLLYEAVEAGQLSSVSHLDEDGLFVLAESGTSCEDLLEVQLDSSGSVQTHGQSLCDWKVGGVVGLNEGATQFVTMDGPDGLECGCTCAPPECEFPVISDLPCDPDASDCPDGSTCNPDIWMCESCEPPPPCDEDLGYTEYDDRGAGTADDPYQLFNVAQLVDLAEQSGGALSRHYIQCQDIRLTNYYAKGGSEFQIGEFTGTYDGLGHEISHFQQLGSFAAGGLFEKLAFATVRNLAIGKFTVVASGSAGALAAEATNASVTAVTGELLVVEGGENVGGLVGRVESSHVAKLDVESDVRGMIGAGGVFGYAAGTYASGLRSKSFVHASVRGAGGMVGGTSGSTFRKASARGSVEATYMAGGFSAVVGGNYVHCSSSADVSGGSRLGGFGAVVSSGRVRLSYASGDVNSTGGSWVSGFMGSAGSNQGSEISDCYASGDVTNPSGFANGFSQDGGKPVTIRRSYASGHLTCGAPWDCRGFDTQTGDMTDVESSFSVTSMTVPGTAGLMFADGPVDSSNYYNADTDLTGNPNGATAASVSAGDFQNPNEAPLSLDWPDGPGAWSFTGPLPNLPAAGY